MFPHMAHTFPSFAMVLTKSGAKEFCELESAFGPSTARIKALSIIVKGNLDRWIVPVTSVQTLTLGLFL